MAEQNAKYLNKCRLLRVFEYMQNTDEQPSAEHYADYCEAAGGRCVRS